MSALLDDGLESPADIINLRGLINKILLSPALQDLTRNKELKGSENKELRGPELDNGLER